MPPVMTDSNIDPDRLMFEGVDDDTQPTFQVSEMAKFFFARSNHWIRWLESVGKMSKVRQDAPKMCKTCKNVRVVEGVDGKGKPKPTRCPKCTEEVGDRRDPKMNQRIYTFGDIEEIAHGLAQNGSISGTQLRQTLRLLRTQAEMYELL